MKRCKEKLQRLLSPHNIHYADHILEKTLPPPPGKRKERDIPIISFPQPDDEVPFTREDLEELKNIVNNYLKGGKHEEEVAKVIIDKVCALREKVQ